MSDEALSRSLRGVPRIEGYTTEVNLDALKWADALAEKVERGWVLAVDYGYPRERYYSPERVSGTLQCYSRHARGLDPLSRPGFCDLTAHVEFTSLAEAFQKGGMEITGFTDQHHFLTGIMSEAYARKTPTEKEARELKTLLHPEMLGTAFQVLGMGKETPGNLAGFRWSRGFSP